jgi:hypothetical protein
MIKKTYLRPTANVVELKCARLVCASLNSVTSTGLDDNESLDYGEGNTTKKNAWENAW